MARLINNGLTFGVALLLILCTHCSVASADHGGERFDWLRYTASTVTTVAALDVAASVPSTLSLESGVCPAQ